MDYIKYILFYCLFFGSAFCLSQDLITPKREVRAVWLATVDYLDWPKPEIHNNIDLQKKTLLDKLDYLKKINFNTIYFQTRLRGNSFYRSTFEPWAKELTGTFGKDPGWDPLSFLIEESHKRGIEVHAWVNVLKVWSGRKLPPESQPEHILLKRPEWGMLYSNEWWLDPGYPECREYLENIVLDIVKNYDIDGVHFDYLRYPEKNFNDKISYGKFGHKAEKNGWRREKISRFLRETASKIRTIKPGIKIGVAPIGVLKKTEGSAALSAYSDVYQDCEKWLKEGSVDYLAPQTYWDIDVSSGDPGFGNCVKDWKKIIYKKHLYPGIAVMRENVKRELYDQVGISRIERAEGNSYYRLSFMMEPLLFSRVYPFPAIPPLMLWKDSIPPLPPTDLRIERNNGINKLSWIAPNEAVDGDKPKFYLIYRSILPNINISDPANLLAVIGANIYSYSDSMTAVNSNYYYCISSLDKVSNESAICGETVLVADNKDEKALEKKESKNIISVMHDSKSEFQNNFVNLFKPAVYIAAYPNVFEEYSLIGYEINGTYFVNLGLFDQNGREVRNLLKGTQLPGKYVLKVSGKNLSPGEYTCRLKFGNYTREQKIVKK